MANKYEAAIVLSVAQGEDATAALKEKFNDLIAKNGTVENVDDWGKRRLAYEIAKQSEGYYYFVKVDAEPTMSVELEKDLRIMENVLRYLIVREEE